jgi:hypothetical protein
VVQGDSSRNVTEKTAERSEAAELSTAHAELSTPTTSDVVEAALARAINAEVDGRTPGWEGRVVVLAGELQARRLARGGVVALDAKRRGRGA